MSGVRFYASTFDIAMGKCSQMDNLIFIAAVLEQLLMGGGRLGGRVGGGGRWGGARSRGGRGGEARKGGWGGGGGGGVRVAETGGAK